jgi:hypothetical protein
MANSDKPQYTLSHMDVILVLIQFQHMTMMPLRLKKGFIDKMRSNIRKCCFDQKFEDELMTLALRASKTKGNHKARIGMCFRAMELIGGLLEHGMR